MRIGGFQKLTLSDYAGKPSCIVFTQGCNFRCPFCHNPSLVPWASPQHFIEEDAIIDYLARRKHLIDGAVITGGEPCLQKDLVQFATRIKALGLSIKLDTNGSRPAMLRQMIALQLVDYIAMDIKAPMEKYASLTGGPSPVSAIVQSIDIIVHAGVDYEFRTTVLSPALVPEDILHIAETLSGVSRYILQPFVPAATLDPDYLHSARSFSHDTLEALRDAIRQNGVACSIRGAQG